MKSITFKKLYIILLLCMCSFFSVYANDTNSIDYVIKLLRIGGKDNIQLAEEKLKNIHSVDARMKLNLATIFFEDTLISENFEKSVYWLERYFAEDTPPNIDILALSVGMLGRSYLETGNNISAYSLCNDYKKLVNDSRLSADIATCLGQIYRDGISTDINFEKAEYWYKKAADQGSNKAMFELNALKTSPKN